MNEKSSPVIPPASEHPAGDPGRPAVCDTHPVRTWQEVATSERMGYLTDRDDIAALVAAHGDFPLVVRDLNDARHVLPASLVARLVRQPAVAFIATIFLAAEHVPRPGSLLDLMKECDRRRAMLERDCYLGRDGQTLDLLSGPIAPHHRLVFTAELARLEYEIAVRERGLTLQVRPRFPVDALHIDTRGVPELIAVLRHLAGEGPRPSEG
jgi:hypothetical protein